MKKYIFVIIILFFGTGCSKDVNNTKPEIEISGKLSMKRGAMTHTRDSILVIKDSSKGQNYMIQNPKEFDLKNKQNHIVTIKAKLIHDQKGPGRFAVIKVTEVKN